MKHHYLLVLYVFGKNFFTERDSIDFTATEKKMSVVWSRKPRVVNFCPYCRAIFASIVCIPFVYVWRLYPHKPKKEKTHEEIMRSMKRRNILIRSIAGGINIALGIEKLVTGEYYFAAIQIGIGVILILAFQFAHVFSPILNAIVNFLTIYWPRKRYREKTPKPVKSPSLIKTYITKKHDVFCPPIAFVDSNDTNIRV